MRGGDEGAEEEVVAVLGSREHDVARFVAHEQRTQHVRRRARHVDDAHAVGELVHDPHLAVGARRDGDRLEADGHRARVREPVAPDVEDLEPVVGRVRGEQLAPVGRERERPHLAALEGHERRGGGCGAQRDGEQEESAETDHARSINTESRAGSSAFPRNAPRQASKTVKAKSTTCEWRRSQPTVRVVQYTPASTVAPPTACAGRKRSPRSVVERSAVRTGTR